ncbi:MAG: hypothetical protein ABJN26_21310 [Stappiaceae bacterium]
MFFELLLAVYIGCAGFVAAGLIASFYQLVTNRPARFALESETLIRILATVAIVIFAGPFILMRNAIRGRRIEGRPIGWLVASTTIAGMWSMCSGVVVIQFALAIAYNVA